jgi:hypothetical protein
MSVNQGKRLFQLSRDHTPSDTDEKKRITEMGGRVLSIFSPEDGEIVVDNVTVKPTIIPGKMTVSRTFGDLEVKDERYGGIPGMIIA